MWVLAALQTLHEECSLCHVAAQLLHEDLSEKI